MLQPNKGKHGGLVRRWDANITSVCGSHVFSWPSMGLAILRRELQVADIT
jgi:hypothetical protein